MGAPAIFAINNEMRVYDFAGRTAPDEVDASAERLLRSPPPLPGLAPEGGEAVGGGLFHTKRDKLY